MIPAKFDYVRPASLDEAVQALAGVRGDEGDAKVIAGGQSLLPLLRLRSCSSGGGSLHPPTGGPYGCRGQRRRRVQLPSKPTWKIACSWARDRLGICDL